MLDCFHTHIFFTFDVQLVKSLLNDVFKIILKLLLKFIYHEIKGNHFISTDLTSVI